MQKQKVVNGGGGFGKDRAKGPTYFLRLGPAQ